MRLSVVIATMNRPDDLSRALHSLGEQTRLPDEVLVVDQSRDERSADVCGQAGVAGALAGRVRYVRQEVPSAARARNAGAELASGDLFSFIDDDVVLLADYYRHVVAEFERDPGLGAVGGSVLNTSYSGLKWRVRQGLSVVFLLNFWNGRMTPSGFGYPIYHRQIRRRTSVQMLHGCNMTVRRSAFGSAGFDSWFTGYSFREDAELSYRISRRWRVIMIPEAQLYHYESASNRLPSLEHKRMEIRNCEYVARKHRPGWWNGFLFRYSLRGLLLLDWLSAFGAADDRKARYDVARQAVRELRQ